MMKLALVMLIVLAIDTKGDDPTDNLPLCPINMQFFPQSLPMHCRMPFKAINGTFPQLAAPFYPPQAQMPAMPAMPGLSPMIPGMPQAGAMQAAYASQVQSMAAPASTNRTGAAGWPSLPYPPQMPMMSVPGMPGVPGMPPMPGMPSPFAPKPPMVVMPYYSAQIAPKTSEKKKKKSEKQGLSIGKPFRPNLYGAFESPMDAAAERDSLEVDSEESLELSDAIGEYPARRKTIKKRTKASKRHKSRKGKPNHRRKSEVLTPVLQYVSKDGYVIYEKKLSQNEAHHYLTEKPAATTQQYVEEHQNEKHSKRHLHESGSDEEQYDENEMYHDEAGKANQMTLPKEPQINHESEGKVGLGQGKNRGSFKQKGKEHSVRRLKPKTVD